MHCIVRTSGEMFGGFLETITAEIHRKISERILGDAPVRIAVRTTGDVPEAIILKIIGRTRRIVD